MYDSHLADKETADIKLIVDKGQSNPFERNKSYQMLHHFLEKSKPFNSLTKID